ncbi:MAG: hypothetical protein IKJ13_05250 [Clostridia bacterium]|nr:hypothetical protein [Clostridia bacterium]MBR3806226.1 hypothetical protein [Clostridia bacterium]
MKKIICKKEYDTAASEVVEKRTFGNFGDADGYEETLYKTADGSYFLYTNGGEESKYPKEDIKRMSKKTAEAWIALGN